MKYESDQIEQDAMLAVAKNICAAIRTAPKGCGVDHLHTCILTGQEKDALADEMERIGKEEGPAFFVRDAGNVRASGVVVLAGTRYETRGLSKICRICGYEGCSDCIANGGICMFEPLDLGIAIGSAVSMAADARMDSRIMFSIGQVVLRMGIFDENVKMVMGIPLSVSGKSPFFDRK